MAKHFKLRLSLPSFHFCRSKQPSSLPKSPSPAATYFFSPVNSKSLDISFPNLPDPPPSTPDHPSFTSHASSSNLNPHNSPVPEKKKKEKYRRINKTKPSICTSISSADNVWFSSEDEPGSLFSSSRSFDSSYDFGHQTIKNKKKKKKKNGTLKVRRLERYVSNSWKAAPGGGDDEAPAAKRSTSVFRRLMPPCAAAEGKVSESFAVVKRSDDPYEDFKRSMLEMILEKQMFEAKDLEQLLQCFLSLNSRHHHAVIVQAFMEIWEDLFH